MQESAVAFWQVVATLGSLDGPGRADMLRRLLDRALGTSSGALELHGEFQLSAPIARTRRIIPFIHRLVAAMTAGISSPGPISLTALDA
jgi:hypothetical protein